ncbi:hypothetical protein NUW58_g2889 [Xylaria curta]|uniref:Uncharacterized protein n=1 Tax=Xylaria curta TaxID=42375 RepID=A0ACC1PE10_9PEZI|nr:hypothetical protein NUW58_g2889 [Xylaria curta]
MAKTKPHGSVPNRHLYSRLSYLHQAAAFLGSQTGHAHDSHPEPSASHRLDGQGNVSYAPASTAADQLRLELARHLLTDLRATSLKSQIRLSPAIKHTICKFCDAFLIEGETSTSVVENKSKHGKKPWADVLVVKCKTCHGVKRFPVQALRQKRRPQREHVSEGQSKGTVKQTSPADDKVGIAMKDG